MAKTLIEIQGNLYDFWEFRSLERSERYNTEEGIMEYLLVVNRGSIQTNYTDVEFVYPTEELREREYVNIKEQLDFVEAVLVIPAGLKVAELKQLIAQAKANTDPTPPTDSNEA